MNRVRATARRFARDDDGYATVAAAGAICAIAAILIAVVYVGAAVVARHRAQSAADLTALAAAIEHVSGTDDPCAAARSVATAQRPQVAVADCRISGTDVVVGTRIEVRLGPFGIRTAEAIARAGPP